MLIGNSKNTLHFLDKALYPTPSKNIIDFVTSNYDRMSRYLDMSGLKKDLTSKYRSFVWSVRTAECDV